MTRALELATLPSVLDIVELMIGPKISLFKAKYIIKEAQDRSQVSRHQDLTYRALSHNDQVIMWLAISPATAQSEFMRMIPGSHKMGNVEHLIT